MLNTDLSFCVVENNYGTDKNPDNFYYLFAYQNLFYMNLEATKRLINQVKVKQQETLIKIYI